VVFAVVLLVCKNNTK